MLVTTLGYDDYRGVTAVGRIFAGTIHAGDPLARMTLGGETLPERAATCTSIRGLIKLKWKSRSRGDHCPGGAGRYRHR